MNDILEQALAEVTADIKRVLGVDDLPAIEPANPKFGADFALPCFTLAKQLGKSPHDIAVQVAGELQHEAIGQLEPVAGYVNIWLSDKLLAEAIQRIEDAGHEYGRATPSDKQIVIETNNPNPFKDLHIGHAYNAIVADTIANLLEASGATVHRVSYHGDVGLHVGRSMWAILKFLDGDMSKLATIAPGERAAFLSNMYVEGSKAHKEDEAAREQIEAYAKESFDLSDPYFADVYQICKQWSFDYLDKALKRLGSQPVEKRYMEREADALGRKVVEERVGDVFQQSDGAIIFPGEKYGLHTRVFISKRGTTLYEARDLGLIQLKHRDFNPDASYIVTGDEQREYFRVVLKAASLALPETKDETINVPTGLVTPSTGKMSSRTGNVINIEWLFDALQNALSQHATEEGSNAAATITGGLRYTMLKVRVGSNLVFDVNESISQDGNTGPYLQYAHARGHSILAKVDAGERHAVSDLSEDEHQLAAKIVQYPAAVQKAADDLSPHHLCSYLYDLTQQFNRFYEHNRVVGDPRQPVRISLVRAYCQVLQNGLELLGMPAPERL